VVPVQRHKADLGQLVGRRRVVRLVPLVPVVPPAVYRKELDLARGRRTQVLLRIQVDQLQSAEHRRRVGLVQVSGHRRVVPWAVCRKEQDLAPDQRTQVRRRIQVERV
jgi:hypothetical protein